MEIVFALLIALALDLAIGEPPNGWHPVAWLGKLISLEIEISPKKGRARQLAYGIGMVLVTLGIVVTPLYFALAYLKEASTVAYVIALGILLKSTFSLRGLKQAAHTVKKLLNQGDLIRARISMRALVSRDTAELSQDQMVSATVESAAENTCDSFVAPLFYFLLFGLPGAIAYRIVNTFDAMVGYHGEWEYLGKFAARLDDVANIIPARLTALFIVLATWICKRYVSQAWQVMLRDHKKTQSPNAGWTMSAIAGALGIQLEKTGEYRLGDNHYPLSLDTIDASLRVVTVTTAIWSLLIVLAKVIYIVAT